MSNVFILLLLRGIQYSANNLWQKYNTKYQEIILTPGFTLFSRAGQCIALQNRQFGAAVRVRGKSVEWVLEY